MVRGPGRLSARSQGVVFLLLTVAVLLGAWRVWLAPERLLRESRQSRLTASRTELTRLRQTTAGLPALQREVRSLEAKLAGASAANPDADEPEHVLDALNDAAIDSGVQLTTFSNAQNAQGGPGEKRRIQLGLEGGFHEVVAFLSHVVALARIGSVLDIAIKSTAKPEARQTVSATVVVETGPTTPALAMDAIPASRGRDPFLAWSGAGNQVGPAPAAAAPAGLGAVAVDQVIVTGIVRAGGVISAVLQAPNRRTFVAKPHDRLLDATVVSIDPGGVTFASLPGRGGPSSQPLRKSLGTPSGVVR